MEIPRRRCPVLRRKVYYLRCRSNCPNFGGVKGGRVMCLAEVRPAAVEPDPINLDK